MSICLLLLACPYLIATSSSSARKGKRTVGDLGALMVEATASDRTIFNFSNFDKVETPLSYTNLRGKGRVLDLIYLPERKYVTAARGDGVFVYDIHATGVTCKTFKRCSMEVESVVQLKGDLIASVGLDKMLISWRAASGKGVDKWKHSKSLHKVMKLDHEKVLVADCDGKLVVF